MAKKKNNKAKTPAMEFYMFPSLHQDVLNALSGSIAQIWFNDTNTDEGANNLYPTNVMGRFRCENNRCRSKSWGSKRVAIYIRGYPGNGYNAVVYNQRCESCQELGQLTLDEASYVDRVSYRLKKWAGVAVARPYYEEKEGPPHMNDLCEGCKRGHCPRVSLGIN